MRLVLACGCFDLLHVGHVRHLQQAARRGDALVVGVTRDSGVNKPGRPIIPEAERLEMVKALREVHGAALCDDSIDALHQWNPQVFCKGSDYAHKGLLDAEIQYCKEHGVTVFFTDENPQTTSKIVKAIRCES